MSYAHGSLFVLGSFVVACCAKVARLPREGESLLATSFSAEPGGKGFNMALAARRLGTHVDCLAAVGDDLFGRLAAPAFASAGLSLAFLRTIDHAATGAGIGFIADGGENCLAVCPGANVALGTSDVAAASDAIRRAALTLATYENGDGPILSAFRLARGADRRTLLNPSPFRPVTADILALTSILVVNQREGAALAASLNLRLEQDRPEHVMALAEALFAAGVEVLVVTLGAHGAIAVKGNRVLRQPAYPIRAVDTLGAGDAFVAGLATALAAGCDLTEALCHGAAAGALTATKAGTFEALPTREQVDALLATMPGKARTPAS